MADPLGARLKQAIAQAQSSKAALRAAGVALDGLLAELAEPEQRGLVNALLWECAAHSERRQRYFSQYGQDAFLDIQVFDGQRDGVFVEVGGFDGITGSNALFFELMRGWTGLLIEPVEAHLAEAAAFRRCACANALIGPRIEQVEFLQIDHGPVQMSGLVRDYSARKRDWVDRQPGRAYRTETRTTTLLADVLRDHALHDIDFISLDVEGTELAILETFPFAAFAVHAWVVEADENRDAIHALMRSNGYTRRETIGSDDIYVLA